MRATVGRLRAVAAVVASVYGPANPAAYRFQRLLEGFERLQRDMQAQAAQDLPGAPVQGFYI